ncbi:hypothetical protein BIY21_10065 [Vibrio ponticus]|uniref:VWFA domain-containing protein n=1 Tax=Vibrio ponticus TaxID=265668 RepID=A0ABX3FJN0_9VIBR|nr:TadE/TadG family type IV pilus assembly protein [Vibrio ponticus]OLQ93990.1 hypothetical protein BIY21_10065 [Vibrio ponticus]
MKHRIYRQKGVAGIMFVLMVPVLFGVFALGSDGAKVLQHQARIQDAAEVAALALSAHADPNLLSESAVQANKSADYGSEVNRKIVADIFAAYFPKQNIVTANDLKTLTIERTTCESCGANYSKAMEYNVKVSLDFDTWFPSNSSSAGFTETVDIGGQATSEKYESQPVDLMLVADYSGSMLEPHDDENILPRYRRLQNIVKDVLTELDISNNNYRIFNVEDRNRVGIVPFNHYAHRRYADALGCDVIQAYQPSGLNEQLVNIEHVVFDNNGYLFDRSGGNADGGSIVAGDNSFVSTVNNIDVTFETDTIADANSALNQSESVCANRDESYLTNFYSMALTDNLVPPRNGQQATNTSLERRFSAFLPQGGTAAYQGLIEGYKLLKNGVNKKRLLVILSDGEDSPEHSPEGGGGPVSTTSDSDSDSESGDSEAILSSYQRIGEKLINEYGLCREIKAGLSEGGYDTTLYFIAFDYQIDPTSGHVNRNNALENCVGPGNVIYETSEDVIKKTILSLVSEEIGHLK